MKRWLYTLSTLCFVMAGLLVWAGLAHPSKPPSQLLLVSPTGTSMIRLTAHDLGAEISLERNCIDGQPKILIQNHTFAGYARQHVTIYADARKSQVAAELFNAAGDEGYMRLRQDERLTWVRGREQW